MTSVLFYYIFILITLGALSLTVYACLGSNTLLVTFSLVGIFSLIGFLLSLLGLEFFGLVYVAVYVGAVCIFFIFALLLFDLRVSSPTASLKDESVFYFYSFAAIFFVLDMFLSGLFYLNFYSPNSSDALSVLISSLETELRVYPADLVFADRRYLRWRLSLDSLTVLESSTNAVAFTEPGCASLNYFLNEKILYLTHEFGSFLYNYAQFFIFILTVLLFIVLLGSLAIVLKQKDK